MCYSKTRWKNYGQNLELQKSRYFTNDYKYNLLYCSGRRYENKPPPDTWNTNQIFYISHNNIMTYLSSY